MAYTVVLKINEESGIASEYQVKKLHCRYERTSNAIVPTSTPRCMGIELTVDSPRKDDLLLTDWYISNRMLSGKVVVCDVGIYTDSFSGAQRVKSDEMRSIVEFENATCYYFSETYSLDQNRQITLHFDAENVITNEIEFKHL